jgi:AcrR family transcriptional regulator
MTTEAKFKYALKEMMLSKPLEEINVTVLCDKCACHRQTFYYHYQDIYDLLAAIFLNEDIEGLDKAKDAKETLLAFFSYAKENFVFLRSSYNSAAHDLGR